MKTTLTAIAFAIIATTANAFTSEQVENCTAIGDLAQTIMDKRQEGISISKLLTVSDNEFVQSMVLAAFSKPLMSYEANKADQSKRFREAYETACYRYIGEPA